MATRDNKEWQSRNNNPGQQGNQQHDDQWDISYESRKRHGVWGNRNNPDWENSRVNNSGNPYRDQGSYSQNNPYRQQQQQGNRQQQHGSQQRDHRGIVAWGSPSMANSSQQERWSSEDQNRSYDQNSMYRRAENNVYHARPANSQAYGNRGEEQGPRYRDADRHYNSQNRDNRGNNQQHRYGAGSYEAELNRDYGENGTFRGGSWRQHRASEDGSRLDYRNGGSFGVSGLGDNYPDFRSQAGNQQGRGSYENNRHVRGDDYNRNTDYSGYGITSMGGDYDREGNRNKYIEDSARNYGNENSQRGGGNYGNPGDAQAYYDSSNQGAGNSGRNYSHNPFQYMEREYGAGTAQNRPNWNHGSEARTRNYQGSGNYGVGNRSYGADREENSDRNSSHEEEFGFRERRGGRDSSPFGGNERY